MALPIPSVESIISLAKHGLTIEAKEKIMELRLSALQRDEEIFELKKQLRELTGQLAIQKDLVFKPPFYYAEGDDTPFCPRCLEKERLAVHVVSALIQTQRPASLTIKALVCPECSVSFSFNDKHNSWVFRGVRK